MDLQAWCGRCGESFRLAELVEPAFTGRCPRCGLDLVGSYGPVCSAAVHELIAAAESLSAAASRLAQSAPHLHIDSRRLTAELTELLDRD